MSSIAGFTGRTAHARALAASRRVNSTPRVAELADGSLVGVGETVLGRDGFVDCAYYGARGTSAWRSEVQP